MKNAHLLASFYFEPWNLRPDYHQNFGQIIQAHLEGKETPKQLIQRAAPAAAAAPIRPIVGPTDDWGNPIVPQMEVGNGVAVIPVHGALGPNLSLLALYCGGVDYSHLAQFAQMALYDPTVHTVVLDFDSPGGSCRGLPECAAVIAQLAAVKTAIAYTSGLCCSAAYYLACYCAEIYSSPSASVGNIGTVLACLDNSREWEMNGWRLELFASGALKGAGFDGKEWTSVEREFFQGWMQKKFGEFKSVVTSNRPEVDPECFDGRWLDGDIAGAFGLVDGVAISLEMVVAAAMQLQKVQ